MDSFVRHLFRGVRVFPDDPLYKSTGLVGKSEIVSLGCACTDYKNLGAGAYDDGMIFCQFDDGTFLSGGKTRLSRKPLFSHKKQ